MRRARTRGVGGDEGRLVLGAGVEQVARAGLDDRAEFQPAQAPGQLLRLRLPLLGERVEMVVVEGQGYAGIARLGHQHQGIVEPVEAVPLVL